MCALICGALATRASAGEWTVADVDSLPLDFPDRALKPADATYPPFLGPFPPTQHLTGSWQPIQQWQKDNAKSLRSG
jgi:hypothetical protein